jgi:hypothetical protein
MANWKYWDIGIAVVGFLIQCGLAWLGLTLTHWKHKGAFIGLVVLGGAFTGWAVKRGIDSSDRTQMQLDAIQHNVEQRPKIEVNVPPPTNIERGPRFSPTERARMSVERVHFEQGTVQLRESPLNGQTSIPIPIGFEGKPIFVRVSVRNRGDFDAIAVKWSATVFASDLLDAGGESQAFHKMKVTPFDEQPDLRAQEEETLNIKSDRALTLDEVNAVHQRRKYLYVMLFSSFRDKVGPQEFEFCGHYQNPRWEEDLGCKGHNR